MTPNYARLLDHERRYGVVAKVTLLLLGGALLALRPAPGLGLVVGLYGLVVALSAAALLARRPGAAEETGGSRWLFWLSQGVDALYVTALITTTGGLSSPLYLLYLLLALKSLLYVPDVEGIVWLPFAFGPLYVLALWLAHGSLGFLADLFFLTRYLLLLGLIVGITLFTWLLQNRLRELDRLRLALAQQARDLAMQTQTLQRTATDLGDRVLELRTLQEAARSLSATLYLRETLRTVAERFSSLVDSPRCAVALMDADRSASLQVVTAEGWEINAGQPVRLEEEDALQTALRSGRSQVLPYGSVPSALVPLVRAWDASGLEVIPLVARGRPIGGLLTAWTGGEAVAQQRRSLLESFAYFAATALENARLYGEVAGKSRELEAMLAGIGDGVLVVDASGTLLLMNPVAQRIFGLSAAPLGADVRSALPAEGLAALLEETAAGGRAQIRELPLPSAGRSSDGEPYTFQALAAPLYRNTEEGEQVSGVVVVLRDITAQKELERMKSNFLSVVSHELKTPLHSIKGFVEIILMGKTGPVTELQRDFLSTVQEQTVHLQRLIEDLLEFSRLESGQVRLRPVPVSPAELARTVVAKLKPLAVDRQLTLELAVPPDLPEVEVDPMRVEQVLTNLVENAIKFTPPGGRVRILAWDRDDAVEMAVADTGIGVPPAERERVFERFYQVDSSVRRRYKGTGLGLTICKHIVTRHGGRIWIEDGKGNGVTPDPSLPGSEFHFTLPKVFTAAQPDEAALDFDELRTSGRA
ncbi:MAG: ATP-binding protein [Anaerolineae bacterium]|nr:ATP-binding protein [Anaerolineae bacterium]